MKINTLKLTKAVVLLTATIGMLVAPAAHATLSLFSSSANYIRSYTSYSSNLGDLICSFDQRGNHQGDLANSYNCSFNNTSINYCGGNSAYEGTCLVIRDNHGGAYVWNICDWNGKDQIDCFIKQHHFDCYDIEIYGKCNPPSCNPPPCNDQPQPPTASVPEPTTLIAGALMLIPLGIQGVRQIRKHKASV